MNGDIFSDMFFSQVYLFETASGSRFWFWRNLQERGRSLDTFVESFVNVLYPAAGVSGAVQYGSRPAGHWHERMLASVKPIGIMISGNV